MKMKHLFRSVLACACLLVASQAFAQTNVSGTISASSTDCTTNSSCVVLQMPSNGGGVALRITGTFSATLQFEASIGGNAFTSIAGGPLSGGSAVTSATSTGSWQFNTAGVAALRVRASTYASGGAAVFIQSSAASPSGSTSVTGGTAVQVCASDLATCAPVDGTLGLKVQASIDTTGLSTSAKQDTGNTSLASIKTDADSLVTNTTGIATSAKQDTGNTSLGTLAGGVSGSKYQTNGAQIGGQTAYVQAAGVATLATAGSAQVIDNFNYYGDGTPMLSTDTGKISAASGAIASGALASGSIASGAVASGAIASGAFASGSVGSGAYASGAIGSGAVASGAIASGAFAAGSLNSAIPDPCTTSAKTSYPISIASATTTVVAAASSSNKFRFCSIFLFASAAENVAVVEDATGSCASPDAGIIGGTTTGAGINLAANQGWTLGNGLGTVAQTASTNVNVCLITSSSAQLSGVIMGVLAP